MARIAFPAKDRQTPPARQLSAQTRTGCNPWRGWLLYPRILHSNPCRREETERCHPVPAREHCNIPVPKSVPSARQPDSTTHQNLSSPARTGPERRRQFVEGIDKANLFRTVLDLSPASPAMPPSHRTFAPIGPVRRLHPKDPFGSSSRPWPAVELRWKASEPAD